MRTPSEADRIPAPTAATRPGRDAVRRRALVPGWLIFFLLGMAAISAIEVLPGSPTLMAVSGLLAAP